MSSYKIHSVLTLDNKPLGVRFTSGSEFADVELASLKGIMLDHIKGYPKQPLIEQGSLFVTQEEIDRQMTITDMSKNEKFCRSAVNFLVSQSQAKSKPAQTPTATSKPKPKASGEKVFAVEVEVPFFDPMTSTEKMKKFNADIPSSNALKARKEAKEWYANDLGVDAKDVKILSCVLKG